MEVFWQVRRARVAHGATRDGRIFDLEPALRRALAHNSKYGFWALEGLGHDHVKAHLEAALAPPRRLLRHPSLKMLDAGQLAAVHAGLGLAAAEFVAGGLESRSGSGRFEDAITRFEALCRDNASSSDQAEVALEALGLVASVFFAPLRPGFESALRIRPRLRRLYWHGAGRGAYFSGSQLLPGYGSISRAASKTIQRAPDAEARRDSLAGLGYALTMVNIEHPSVLAGGLVDLGPSIDESADRLPSELGSDLGTGLGTGIAGALAMQRLLGEAGRADLMLEETRSAMPEWLWRSMLHEPYQHLRSEGRRHGLYGSLPWGRV